MVKMLAECRQLLSQRSLGYPCVLKTEVVVEGLADEVSLAHTPTSIHGAELRLLFFKKPQQLPLLFLASNNHRRMYLKLISAANVVKKFL